jgi:hypothetical protein
MNAKTVPPFSFPDRELDSSALADQDIGKNDIGPLPDPQNPPPTEETQPDPAQAKQR